jgi:DNA-binding NtrC family response regulator
MSARIIVAADAPMVVGILGHKLRREGHQVTCARGAAELRRALDAGPYDCGVCETALLDEIRRRIPSPDGDDRRSVAPQPLRSWLAIVDGRDEAAAMRAMREGAAGIVRTPFKPTAVAAQVAALLAIVGVEA